MTRLKTLFSEPLNLSGLVACVIVVWGFFLNWSGLTPQKLLAAVSLAGFIPCFVFVMLTDNVRLERYAFVAQVILVLGYQLSGQFNTFVLFIILCAQASSHFSGRRLVLVFLLFVLEQYLVNHYWYGLSRPAFDTFMMAGLEFFCLVIGYMSHTASTQAQTLRLTNSELLATRALVDSGARNDERLRLSRELHDVAGHRLAALTLQMDLALQLPKEQADEHIKLARSEASKLLDDIHAVVGQLRQHDAVALRPALELLIERIPRPVISLHMPDDITITQLGHADILLRCVQEAITNALKHAEASEMTIAFSQQEQRLHLVITDNGRGTADTGHGYGLKGMRERLQPVGGELELQSAPGQGFALTIYLPLENTA